MATSEIIFFGGGFFRFVNAVDVQIHVENGRVQTIEPLSAGKSVKLPAAPKEGTRIYFWNPSGSFTIDIKSAAGTVLQTLGTDEVGTFHWSGATWTRSKKSRNTASPIFAPDAGTPCGGVVMTLNATASIHARYADDTDSWFIAGDNNVVGSIRPLVIPVPEGSTSVVVSYVYDPGTGWKNDSAGVNYHPDTGSGGDLMTDPSYQTTDLMSINIGRILAEVGRIEGFFAGPQGAFPQTPYVPFILTSGATIPVPNGAVELVLGMHDTGHHNNQGSVEVQATFT